MKKENTVLYILRLTVTLLLICAAVAAVLAGVNAITKDKIADIQAQKTQDAIAVVLPGAAGVEEIPVTGESGIVTAVYAADAGYAVQVAPGGFDGAVTMMVGVADGKVTPAWALWQLPITPRARHSVASSWASPVCWLWATRSTACPALPSPPRLWWQA